MIKENIDLNLSMVYGKVNWFDNRPTIPHPELTKINNYNIKKLVVYIQFIHQLKRPIWN